MTTSDIRGLAMIRLDELHPSPANPRQRMTDLDELAASIVEVGLIQPLVVQKIPGQDGFQIIAGHRRHAAARKARLEKVPCVVRHDMLPDEELLAMLVENGQRADLDPIEEARALKRLKDAGMTDAEIGIKIGRHQTWVKRRLDYLRLPPAEQEALRAGHYTLRHANNLLRAEREQQRRRENPTAKPVGRPKGAKTRPHFGDQHPLARIVRAACDHTGRAKVGAVGCGPCWETAIREHEREQLQHDHLEPIGATR